MVQSSPALKLEWPRSFIFFVIIQWFMEFRGIPVIPPLLSIHAKMCASWVLHKQLKSGRNSVQWCVLGAYVIKWCRNRGGQGGHWPPQYFADQLTLFEPGRADFPHLLLLAPPMFFTFRHHWTDSNILCINTLYRSKRFKSYHSVQPPQLHLAVHMYWLWSKKSIM